MSETGEKTYITSACQAAMIEHGVLMKDGKPAGMELMNKDILRIAVVEAGENGNFPAGFVTEELIDAFQNYPETVKNPSSFPVDDVQSIVRKAMSHWTTAKIEFVSFEDSPDIQIFPFSSVNSRGAGIAPLELYDDPQSKGRSSNYIALTDSYVTKQQVLALYEAIMGEKPPDDFIKELPETKPYEIALLHTLKHEIGHVLGVLHPFDAADVFKTMRDQNYCDEKELNYLDRKRNPGIMSYGVDGKETWYDRGTREFVQTGIAPKPDGGMKP